MGPTERTGLRRSSLSPQQRGATPCLAPAPPKSVPFAAEVFDGWKPR